MPIAFDMSGELDLSLLSRVFHTIIERHEILLTVYSEESGHTYQHVLPMSDIGFHIKEVDLTYLTGETLETAVAEQATLLTGHAFNLSCDIMVRVSYVKRSVNSGVLLLNMHHIGSDGWSMEVLLKEFFTLYHTYSMGEESALAPLEIQYQDYA